MSSTSAQSANCRGGTSRSVCAVSHSPRYATFEVAEPPVNLSLNEVGGETGQNNPVAHFGIQVKSSDAVKQIADRLQQAGLETRIEENVT